MLDVEWHVQMVVKEAGKGRTEFVFGQGLTFGEALGQIEGKLSDWAGRCEDSERRFRSRGEALRDHQVRVLGVMHDLLHRKVVS